MSTVNDEVVDPPIDPIDGLSTIEDAVADRWLRTFVAVAGAGTFTGAAAEIGIGQYR